MTTEEDELIHKVLAKEKAKREISSEEDDDEADDVESVCEGSTKGKEAILPKIDENDMNWAENYIEQQQTQLILSLLDDTAVKSNMSHDDQEQPDIGDGDDFKSLRPTLETLGIEPVKSAIASSTDSGHPTTSSATRHRQVVLDLPEWHPSIDLTNEDLDLTGIDDNEIDGMILTRDETKLKLKSWLRENKDWFLEEKRRQRNKEAAEQKKTSSSGMTAAQRRKRKKKAAATNESNKLSSAAMGHHQLAGFNSLTPAGLAAAAHSALEAEKHSHDRRVSTKINYDVLKKLTMKKDGEGHVPASPAVSSTDQSEGAH